MKPLRVLVVRIGSMGDVLHAMPAVAALRQRRPDTFISWAMDPRWADLLQISGDEEDLSQGIGKRTGPALIDTWYSVPTKRWGNRPLARKTLSDISLLKELLRGERFDVVVDLQGSLKSAVVGWMAGGKALAGSAEPRERFARRFYTQRVTLSANHVVEQACEIMAAALGEPLSPVPFVLPMQPEHESWADQEIGDERFCLIVPAAGWGAKEWPPDRFAEVAQALRRMGYEVLVNATGPEDAVARRVAAASGDRARLLPCTLGQLIALTRRAQLVVGGDTGPLHLAAALARPVVGIYGPTNPSRTGPWATRSRVLRDSQSITSHKRVKEPETGMLRVDAAAVIHAATELLGEKGNHEHSHAAKELPDNE